MWDYYTILLQMNPQHLTVYQCPFPKLRIGKEYDGGYIIAEIPDVQYDIFLAGGISDDISFESGFLSRFPDVVCFAFDGTISGLPEPNEDIEFIRKNIGDIENDTQTNMHDIIEESEHLFVKMDIEGGEIPWVLSLSDAHLAKMDQIVMEFHFPFSEREDAVFAKLNSSHVMVHFHANNCCGVRNHHDVVVPNVFECTYVHKRHFTEAPVLNTDPIPCKLDMRNVIHHEEISLSHAPFVHARD